MGHIGVSVLGTSHTTLFSGRTDGLRVGAVGVAGLGGDLIVAVVGEDDARGSRGNRPPREPRRHAPMRSEHRPQPSPDQRFAIRKSSRWLCCVVRVRATVGGFLGPSGVGLIRPGERPLGLRGGTARTRFGARVATTSDIQKIPSLPPAVTRPKPRVKSPDTFSDRDFLSLVTSCGRARPAATTGADHIQIGKTDLTRATCVLPL